MKTLTNNLRGIRTALAIALAGSLLATATPARADEPGAVDIAATQANIVISAAEANISVAVAQTEDRVAIAQTEAEPMRMIADFDRSGRVEVLDFYAYLTAWFAGRPEADTDGNGVLTVYDLLAFVNLWMHSLGQATREFHG